MPGRLLTMCTCYPFLDPPRSAPYRVGTRNQTSPHASRLMCINLGFVYPVARRSPLDATVVHEGGRVRLVEERMLRAASEVDHRVRRTLRQACATCRLVHTLESREIARTGVEMSTPPARNRRRTDRWGRVGAGVSIRVELATPPQG